MSELRHLNIEVTGNCNQRCAYCFNDSGPLQLKTRVSFEEWAAALRVLRGAGLRSLHVTGGEPFVWKQTVELLEYAQSISLRTSTLSNGFQVPLLSRRRPDVFRRLAVAQISLDSADAAVHDSRRGVVGSWSHALEAIRALRHLEVPVEASCTTSTENLPDLDELASLCTSLGAKLLLRPLVSIGRAQSGELQAPGTPAFRAALDRINARHPGLIVSDRFQYVLASSREDLAAQREGIVTVAPDGSFRSGPLQMANLCEATRIQDVLAA